MFFSFLSYILFHIRLNLVLQMFTKQTMKDRCICIASAKVSNTRFELQVGMIRVETALYLRPSVRRFLTSIEFTAP